MLKKATIAVHHGLNSDEQYGCVVPPIYLSSTYNFLDFNKPRNYDYSRRGNPSRDIVQKTLAELEGGAGAVLTNTGMSAIYLIITALLKPGDLIIAPYDCYGGTYRLLDSLNKCRMYSVVFIDQSDHILLKKTLLKKPKLLFIESPSNPLLRVVDIAYICSKARHNNIISIVDNTFLSPILQNPLKLGADLVVHSCTKYINGHSDVLGGVIISSDSAIIDQLLWWANNIGVTGSAFDSYLLLRGIRTLASRINCAQSSTLLILDYLKKQSLIKKIYYPALTSNLGYKFAISQQLGFGAILSFELDVPELHLRRFLQALNLFTLAESLGGVESLIAHPATMTHAGMSKECREIAGISEKLLRLSIGLEDPADLIADLDNAFNLISTN